MKKVIISKLFLYRYRFLIGYIILGLAFLTLLFVLPLIAQTGLSEAEIESATNSYYLGRNGILNGDLVDLPYRILQKLSIMFFGLSAYAIKLPSILVGIALGLLLVLLLNRWFKSNVSLLASCLIILSTPFLFLAGSGTPLIMLVFWPTLLLWLGSKIQGEKRPKPIYCFLFAIMMLFSIFTPYMVYFAIFCIVFVLLQPHLRQIIKKLPKPQLICVTIMLIFGFLTLGISIINHPETIMELLFAKNFEINNFFTNITSGLALLFSWHANIESVFLVPLVSLPLFALALIGLFSTTKNFFASRNSIASLLLVFCLIIVEFNPSAIIFIILPLAILSAHGIKYLLEQWYKLFPENPYARIFALLPITILFSAMIVPGLLQYIYGYRYNPFIANEFHDELNVIRKNISEGTLVVSEKYDFYKILEASTNLIITESYEENLDKVAFLGKPELAPKEYVLSQIISSPKRNNSDIIYMYTKKGE